MFQGRKILVTEGGGHFGHMLGSELKKMGAVVVLNDISRLLDEVVNEQWNFFSGRLDWEITQFTLDFFT